MLQAGAVGGISVLLPSRTAPRSGMRAGSGGRLDPAAIRKYAARLPIPPVMPQDPRDAHTDLDFYTIGVRQFRQQVLPPGSPATTVWGYGSARHPGTFHYPAFTIEAKVDRPVRVRWVNELLDAEGRYLPHLLPVDPTLHWANPPGGRLGRDSRPEFTSTPGPYTGPVPIVTHLHGGLNTEESDGYPEAWYLPDARDVPASYARTGSFYDKFRIKAEALSDARWGPGDAVFQYANEGRASTLWYHDHCLGITRLNVYAGLAGFYLMRGGPSDVEGDALPGPAPRMGDPPGARYYEIPVVIQDRSFHADGSLLYPASRARFDGFKGPYIPASDIPPIWNPEFFGDTMLANGRTWPVLPVEPRRYRFRFLNGCNSRTLILKVVADPLARRPASPALTLWQIGSDGGFLQAPVELGQLLVAPAERVDVVVDFTGLPTGAELYLINEGPDDPFQGGRVGADFSPADPKTTGQVMKFVVRPLTAPDRSTPPSQLTLPSFKPLGGAFRARRLSLNEADSLRLPGVGPRVTLLGTVESVGRPDPLGWDAPVTENPTLESTEIWELWNFTVDAHPIHVHEVQFQVVDRRRFGELPRPPEVWERGFKDTVLVYPKAITRVKVRFSHAGQYVWHCHMLEHEDNEMMRPFTVSPR
ncbi:multicopper oxidase [Actinomadura rubrobrunea]|uniref:Multicopper oxidase n=2 Tax=Actinomadura rubrobrunea TaxID=115335 RepID=A0A9W6PZS5_9ACTN|nr:multicopper oxidase [Actinomadura rubrobrunea]